MRVNEVKAKRGDTLTLQENGKEPSVGRVIAVWERPGYFEVQWADGRVGHVHRSSRGIIAVNGKEIT